MKFVDEAIITVQSGNGGSGCVSFRRERFIPRGGPDGGDGGDGGNVILLASPRKRTLHHFQYKRNFKAPNGGNGQGKQKTGKSGQNLTIEVPPGTLVIRTDSGEILKDFTSPGETFVLAKGGRGGQGNMRFKTSTRRAPRFAQPGQPGQSLSVKLELKLLADVGIIGLPNAGKSTLISALSAARPKIGNYPFTTLTPNLGVVISPKGEPFVIADIPGLIEGAHQGAGLGTRFLRHIERTRILVHLVDASAIDPADPLGGVDAINKELTLYRESLIEKPQILVLNKLDVPAARKGAENFMAAAKTRAVISISALTGQGLDELILKIVQGLDSAHEIQ